MELLTKNKNIEEELYDEDTKFEIENYYFNRNTLEYCYKRLSVVIYGQQLYAIEKNLSFIKGFTNRDYSTMDINIYFKDCDYKEYILSKVILAGDKYGLIFLKDEKFILKLKKILNVKTLIQEKEKVFK